MFSFFLSFFRLASSNLRDTFTMIFTQNNSIFRWAVHQLITFFTALKSHEGVRTSHRRTMASFALPFFLHLYACAQITQQLLKIAELEIWLRAWRQGADSVFEQSLVSDSWANTAYMYWGSLWGQTCCSVIDGKPHHKHAPAANKESDINKVKQPQYHKGLGPATSKTFLCCFARLLCSAGITNGNEFHTSSSPTLCAFNDITSGHVHSLYLEIWLLSEPAWWRQVAKYSNLKHCESLSFSVT